MKGSSMSTSALNIVALNQTETLPMLLTRNPWDLAALTRLVLIIFLEFAKRCGEILL